MLTAGIGQQIKLSFVELTLSKNLHLSIENYKCTSLQTMDFFWLICKYPNRAFLLQGAIQIILDTRGGMKWGWQNVTWTYFPYFPAFGSKKSCFRAIFGKHNYFLIFISRFKTKNFYCHFWKSFRGSEKGQKVWRIICMAPKSI
jgi:hypothetical protein